MGARERKDPVKAHAHGTPCKDDLEGVRPTVRVMSTLRPNVGARGGSHPGLDIARCKSPFCSPAATWTVREKRKKHITISYSK